MLQQWDVPSQFVMHEPSEHPAPARPAELAGNTEDKLFMAAQRMLSRQSARFVCCLTGCLLLTLVLQHMQAPAPAAPAPKKTPTKKTPAKKATPGKARTRSANSNCAFGKQQHSLLNNAAVLRSPTQQQMLRSRHQASHVFNPSCTFLFARFAAKKVAKATPKKTPASLAVRKSNQAAAVIDKQCSHQLNPDQCLVDCIVVL